MKKIFFSLIFVMLASCSDMAPEDATKQDLPDDFIVSVYSKINPDVANAQLAFSIKALEPAGTAPAARLNDCRQQFAGDISFAEDIYLNYVGCPRKGWNNAKPCEGQAAFKGWGNADGYSSKDKDGKDECKVPGCFASGWDEPLCSSLAECNSMGLPGYDYSNVLKNNWESHLASKTLSDSTLVLVCTFNVFGENSKEYIKNYKYDSTLITKHFILAGHYEGRPYRYCGSDDFEKSKPRSAALATLRGGKFYDYSANLFCLSDVENGGDGKIYKIK
jgi:hypothetical protein